MHEESDSSNLPERSLSSRGRAARCGRNGLRLCLGVVLTDDLVGAATDLDAVVDPDALAPVAVTTRLRRHQMEQRVAKAPLVGSHLLLLENDLIEMRAHLLHWAEQRVIAAHPGDVVGPRTALHVEAVVLPLALLDRLGK